MLRGLRLLAALGILDADEPGRRDVARLELPFAADAQERVDRVLARRPGPYAVLHPGSSRPESRWDPGGFAAAGRVHDAAGIRVVVTGDRADARLASQVAALVDGARLVLTNDTGMSHVAAAAYPEAHVALLGREHHRAILRTRPSPVDEVVVLPGGVIGDEAVPLDLSARSRVVAEIARRRWDLAVQLHGGGGNSNAFIAALDARVTAGSRADGAPALDRWISYEHYQPEIARYLEVVGLVGAAPVALEPRLAVVDADRAARDRELPELESSGAHPPSYAVIHPGATDPRRRWPVASFADVARDLLEQGSRVVVTGVPEECALVDELVERMGPSDRVLRATGLSLAGLLGLLGDADVVVSNDTGPLHLAIAVDTPTVGIFWIGNLINAGPFTRRRHRPLIAWRATCPECGAPTTGPRCEHDVSFVDEVTAEAAIDAARALLAARHAPPGHAPTPTRVASGRD